MSKVSIIIPVKNRAELLRKTLDNLLNQSLPPHEIIVVDDHSDDNIRQVIFDYITEATFLNNEGRGPGAARNLGLSVATGDYIQFFDSDDLMSRNKLELQARALDESGADMAYGPYVKATEEKNGWTQTDVVMQWHAIPGGLNLKNAILRGWNAITQACLFRRDFLQKAPKWDENLITHEDYLYLFRLGMMNPKMVHVPDAGVLYRQHGAQSTGLETMNLSRSRDKMSVMVSIRKELKMQAPGFADSVLFSGRFAQAYDYLAAQGEDMRSFKGYCEITDPLWKQVYRVYNKIQRLNTGTDWEPVHGISTEKKNFNLILNACIHG